MRLTARVLLIIVGVGATTSLLGCAGEPSREQAYLASELLASELSDQDMDGVIDGRDNCPATPNSLMVDSDGCKLLLPQVDHYQLAIEFRHGSGYLHPKFYPEIKRLAKRLQSNNQLTLLLEGYASKSGDASVNYKLSLRRA